MISKNWTIWPQNITTYNLLLCISILFVDNFDVILSCSGSVIVFFNNMFDSFKRIQESKRDWTLINQKVWQILCALYTAPEGFELNGCFTLKKHQLLSISDEFKNAPISCHFGFVFEGNSLSEIAWLSWHPRACASFTKSSVVKII